MGRKAQNNVKLLGGRPIVTGHRTGPNLPYGRLRIRRRDLAARRPWRSNGRPWVHQFRRRDSESSVDDLGTWRGVVLGRAVTTLRSVETQPYAWGFVLSVRRGPTEREWTSYMYKEHVERKENIVQRTLWIIYITHVYILSYRYRYRCI